MIFSEKSKVYFLQFFILIFTLIAILFVISPVKTSSLNGSSFDSGNIISDEVFYNSNSMSVTQIQAFLNAKMPSCDTNGTKIYSGSTTRAQYGSSKGYPAPYTCLKNYTETIPTITNGGSDLCTQSISGGNKSAAQLILDVSKACGINPQVIIVLLQKEQSLITDEWPWPTQYQKATGYGCPDTAPCDSEYYGFFNQIYNAAKAFRRYEANPDSFNYKAGRNNNIYYHPDLGRCGYSNVFIENQATANLYIYTPYQPNTSALNNLYGTGDSCSSYGNRNFWRLFNDWFGSTRTSKGFVLVNCEGSNFIVENGYTRKRQISDEAMDNFGFDENDFLTDTYHCNYSNYNLSLDKTIRSRKSKKIYFVDNSKAYFIHSNSVSGAWGLGNINVDEYPFMDSENIVSLLSTVPALPIVVTSDNQSVKTYYLIDGQTRYAISGTSVNNLDSLRLITGDFLPTSTISVSKLLDLSVGSEINYSFTNNSNMYFFDYYKIRLIPSWANSRWSAITTGPNLSNSFFNNFPELSGSFGFGFTRDDYTYRLSSDGSKLEKTDSSIIKNQYWNLGLNPSISRLLKNKIRNDSILENTGTPLKTNIRLVKCSGVSYIVERFRPVRREISNDASTNSSFDGKYFNAEDRACNYPVYINVFDRLLKSRKTGKIYYIDSGNAYYVYNQDIADSWGFGDLETISVPKFDSNNISDNYNVVQILPEPGEL